MVVQTALDEWLSIREGRLFIEECDAHELARRFGTPTYVMSEDQLVFVRRDQAEWIRRPDTAADIFDRDLVPHRLRRAPMPR
jgi:hypothetical protein